MAASSSTTRRRATGSGTVAGRAGPVPHLRTAALCGGGRQEPQALGVTAAAVRALSCPTYGFRTGLQITDATTRFASRPRQRQAELLDLLVEGAPRYAEP